MDQKNQEFELVKGKLPSTRKETFEWEKKAKHGFEPWHLSCIALILDVLILCMYIFVDAFAYMQLTIGYVGFAINGLLLGTAYYLIKSKKWDISIIKFTGLINMTALCITTFLFLLTLLLS